MALDLERALDVAPERSRPRTAASVSTQTVACAGADVAQQRTEDQPAASGRYPLLERGHRQAGVAELLPVQLGGLLVAAPDDRLAGVVDAVGHRVAAVDGDAGDVARQRVRDVVERVVVVVADDHPPGAAQARCRDPAVRGSSMVCPTAREIYPILASPVAVQARPQRVGRHRLQEGLRRRRVGRAARISAIIAAA